MKIQYSDLDSEQQQYLLIEESRNNRSFILGALNGPNNEKLLRSQARNSYSDRTKEVKREVKEFIKDYSLSDMRAKLLLALSDLKPKKEKVLAIKCSTADLNSLIKDTREYLNKVNSPWVIKACTDLKIHGAYRLEPKMGKHP